MDNTLTRHSQLMVVPEQTVFTEPEHPNFITANTVESTFQEIKNNHIIPVFVKDNEPAISQAEFIEATYDVVKDFYSGEQLLKPTIRLSHPIKGRVPDAKDKPAMLLKENEKTIYYERMAFIIEIPSITDDIDGNRLSLTVGGVKGYNLDNLYNRKGADEHFKVFVGFKNRVCTNLCVWSDGYMSDLKVKSVSQLKACIYTMLQNYNTNYHLFHLKQLPNYQLTGQQFALLIGRCRMYQHLPNILKNEVAPLLFGDNQIGAVCRDYYSDESFCKDEGGDINLWKLYNLFTGVNKTTYIDSFLDRSVHAYGFIEQLKFGLDNKQSCWYLN